MILFAGEANDDIFYDFIICFTIFFTISEWLKQAGVKQDGNRFH